MQNSYEAGSTGHPLLLCQTQWLLRKQKQQGQHGIELHGSCDSGYVEQKGTGELHAKKLLLTSS